MTIRGRLMLTASWLACRLPEGPLYGLAELIGELWYRLTPGRAAQARRNLRRVVQALAASGRGSASVRAAASDPRALERLVRSAYRHAARYYVEVARNPSVTPAFVDERLQLDTPELIAEAVVPGKAVLFVGLHFGSVEMAVIFLAFRVGETVTPMETIEDAGLQAYFERTRGVAGIRLVGLREARRELTHALRNGIPVGLVGDRDLTGGGTLVPLFGAPALMPMGPAMLAVETGVPTYGMTVRRAGDGHFRGKIIPIDVPAEGTRRERVTTTMTRLAAAFEDLIADAPDQWWAVFFPIWPDLEAEAGGTGDHGRDARGPRRQAGRSRGSGMTDASDPTPRLGRADLHIHTLASDGTAGIAAILDHVQTRTDLDVIAITDHERIDAAVAAQAIARDRGLRAEVVVGEEVTTLGGHLLGLYLDRPIRPYRSLRTSILAVHEAGGLAIPAHPLVPYPLCAQGWVLRRLLEDPDPAARPDALETFNPTSLGKPWHRRVVRFADDNGLAHVGNSDAHALEAIGTGWTTFPGSTAAELRHAIETGTTEHGGTFHETAGQLGTFGNQLRKRGRDARDEVAGRVRRDGTGRDHGYPGGRLRPPRYESGIEPGSTERR